MKLNLIKGAAIVFVALGSIAFQAQGITIPDGAYVDVGGNTVGLNDDATCWVKHASTGLEIECGAKDNPGRVFKNVGIKPIPPTASELAINFGNYIGKITGIKIQRPGAPRTIAFCDGKCAAPALETSGTILP